MSDDRAPGQRGDRAADPAAGLALSRHLGGFVASGLLAFLVDAAVLEGGIRLLGLDPRIARVLAIAVATVVAWLAHRRLTFAVSGPPTLAELGRYTTAAWSAAALNYLVFAATVTLWPAVPTLAALVGATGVATIFSYIALRWGVFRTRR